GARPAALEVAAELAEIRAALGAGHAPRARPADGRGPNGEAADEPTPSGRCTRYLVEPYDGTSLPADLDVPNLSLGRRCSENIRQAVGWSALLEVYGFAQTGKTALVARALRDAGLARRLGESGRHALDRPLAVLYVPLAGVSKPGDLERVLGRACGLRLIPDDYVIPHGRWGDEPAPGDETRTTLLDRLFEWLQRRRAVVVVDNAENVLPWKKALTDLLGLPWVNKAVALVLITREPSVGLQQFPPSWAGKRVLSPDRLDEEELRQAWRSHLPELGDQEERVVDLVTANSLKPAQVSDLLDEVKRVLQTDGASEASRMLDALVVQKWSQAQELMAETLRDTLGSFGSQEEQQRVLRGLMVAAVFGHNPLPQPLFAAAGCDERLLAALRKRAWVRDRDELGERDPHLDPYLVEVLRQLWSRGDGAWAGGESELQAALERVLQAAAETPAAWVELLESALDWVRRVLPALTGNRLELVFDWFRRRAVSLLLFETCDDLVLPFLDEEVERAEEIDDLELEPLVGCLVALSRRSPGAERIPRLLRRLERTIRSVRESLSADVIRRLDFALWKVSRSWRQADAAIHLRWVLYEHLSEHPSDEWGWCKVAAHYCLN
ncbi:MAG: ATP-binding protein, partial [Gemmataceae bacterium]|nr:ATP-binding protein [Gemmataceae bacterium]